MRDRVTLWMFSAGWRVVRALPERLAYLVLSLLALQAPVGYPESSVALGAAVAWY